jgi:hypothetical protein
MDKNRGTKADDGASRQAAPSGGWLRNKEAGPRAALATLVALLTLGFVLHVRWLASQPDLPRAVKRAGSWLQVVTGDDLPGVSLVFGPFIALVAFVAGVLVHYGMPQVWQSARRSLQVGGILGACLAAAWFVGTTRLGALKGLDWLFFVPIVPPALLAFQALLTWRQRPRSVGDFRIGVSAPLRKALEDSGELKCFQEVHAQLLGVFGGVVSNDRGSTATALPKGTNRKVSKHGSYTPTSFATRFAVPGLLLLLVGFGVLSLAFGKPPADGVLLNDVAVRALKWGVGGAYTYVLFTFGSRSFRNDLTVGATVWAMVTLITGPTLAVVLGLVWNLKADPTTGWQSAIVLFFAGLAPRRVMSIVESVALQFLKSPNEAVASRLIPLTTLRGISPELALRLREENIEDVTALAYADPIRLVQSMPYDLRQVVEWIDQAQLAIALPDQFETLLNRGVTGSIDLAWRWLQACVDPKSGAIAIAHASTAPASFAGLVREPGRESELVYDAARQMFYEEHVRLLWVMYNCFSTTAGDQESAPYQAEGPVENARSANGSDAPLPLDLSPQPGAE